MTKGGYVKRNVVLGAFGSRKGAHGIVQRIIEPEEGGIFTKFLGCNYLFKGYPSVRVIRLLRIPKNASKYFVKLVNNKIVVGVLFLLPRFIIERIVLRICEFFVDISYAAISGDIPDPKKYCISVREIHRALTITIIAKIKDKRWKVVAEKVRDMGCTLLEHDFPYRARKQDVLPLLDIEALKKSPIKELQRVLGILIERESITTDMKDKWRKYGRAPLLFLRFNKEARRKVVEFLSEIDLEKIKLDEADWYYCLDREDYNYRGVSFEDRVEEQKRIDREKGHQTIRAALSREKRWIAE